MKIIPAAHLKQSRDYIAQQQYRKMLELDALFSDNGKGIISYCVRETAMVNYCGFVFTKKATWVIKIKWLIGCEIMSPWSQMTLKMQLKKSELFFSSTNDIYVIPRLKPLAHLVADIVMQEESVWNSKDRIIVGTWNVWSVNVGKLNTVKCEMNRLHWHLKHQWTEMDWQYTLSTAYYTGF